MTPELEKLLASLEQYNAKAGAVPPAKRNLKFGVYSGQGYVRGDEVRVHLACELFNAREQILELLREVKRAV